MALFKNITILEYDGKFFAVVDYKKSFFGRVSYTGILQKRDGTNAFSSYEEAEENIKKYLKKLKEDEDKKDTFDSNIHNKKAKIRRVFKF